MQKALRAAVLLGGCSARTSRGSLGSLGSLPFTEVMSRSKSSATPNISFEQDQSSDKNVISSRYSDCFLHELSITQRFIERASFWPEKIAVECGLTGRKYTYDQLRTLVRKFGSCLLRMGFHKGDVLGLVLPNIPEFPVALLGAAGVGMPVTTVNPIYTAEEIARQMQNSGASVILTIPLLAPVMRKVAELCPQVRQLIVVGDAVEGFASMKEMLGDPGDLYPDNLQLNVYDDIFVLPYSSGTTGLPKGVMLTHFNIGANVQQTTHPGTVKLYPTTDSHQETQIALLPFFHIYGMLSVLLDTLDYGGRLITLPRFEPETFLKAIDDFHPTTLQLVPPLINFLSNTPNLNLNSLDRLHTVSSGAAPLGPTAATKLLSRINSPNLTLQEGFGMTETSPVCLVAPIEGAKLGSCGVPISRTKVKIVDINTGEALGPGQEGEMCVYGPQVMKGYYNNAKATEEIIDPSGWLHTGDIAYYDEDMQFYIVDRLKELIKVKGLQVAPSELEDMIRAHPGVLDIAVIGVPDDAAGELPRAYIVRKPNESGQSLTEDEIHMLVDSQVAPHKRLKGGIVFVDNVPKSNTGKILRRELKAALLKSA